MTSMTRLGIFGGTFDPPHIAHLILAAEAQAQLALERVLWVLTPYPPHKTGQAITPLEERLELLRLALGDEPAFELSRVDLERPPPHYAVDTVRLFRQGCPGAQLIYLMGGDSLEDLLTWHAPAEFLAACDGLGVMMRPGRLADLQVLEQKLPGVSAKVQFIQAPLIDISSTYLRLHIAQGLPFRYYLPEKVYQRIQERQLYT